MKGLDFGHYALCSSESADVTIVPPIIAVPSFRNCTTLARER
jgi:hypothetical protein